MTKQTISLTPTVQRVLEHIERTRRLRDEHDWPEPRTIDDLRCDPRVQLRNRLDSGEEDLELAAALILMVAEDRDEPSPPRTTTTITVKLDGDLIAKSVVREIGRQLKRS